LPSQISQPLRRLIEALRHLILDELRRIKAEKVIILSKYNVKSFEDLMKVVEGDKVSDVDSHDDIVRLDYLENRERELKGLLKLEEHS
jgi:hypothetical protein